MGHLEGRRVVQLGDLLLHCLDDFLAAMTGVTAPQARSAVQNLATIGGGIVHVLGFHEKPWVTLELPVCRERHPVGIKVVCCQAGDLFGLVPRQYVCLCHFPSKNA